MCVMGLNRIDRRPRWRGVATVLQDANQQAAADLIRQGVLGSELGDAGFYAF